MDGVKAKLVGRAAECGRISRALDSARRGAPNSLVLRGPPGVGKSALLDWVVGAATGCTILRATGTLRDMYDPFSLLESLLPGEPSSLDGAGLRGRSALSAHLGGGDVPVDRFKVAAVLCGILSSLAELKPVLVVVDDAQWADQSSLDALLLARARLVDDAVNMLFAQRDGEPCVLDRVDLPTIDVEGLLPSEASDLLEGAVEPAVARQLAAHTAGNPLALLELAATLDNDQRAGKAPLSPWLLRTPTVEAGFLRRVHTLPPDAQRVLEHASVDSAVEPSVLRSLADARSGDTDQVESLVELGFLRLDEHERFLVFTHPLLRTAVYQAMDSRVRRDVHLRLASMLRRDDDVTRRAWHLAGATDGPDETAAGELERAGQYSLRRGAYAVAAETFERSADLTIDRRCRTNRLLAAGDAYWLAGQVERSAQVLDLALTLAPDQALRADVQLKRVSTQRTRSSSDMFDELEAEAIATETVDKDRAAMLFAQSVMPGMAAMRLDATLHSATRALEILDPQNPMYFMVRMLHALVSAMSGRNQQSLPVMLEFAAAFDAVGPGPQFSGLAEYSALMLLAGDDVETALRLVDGMIDYARRESVLGLLPLPLSVRAEVRLRCGAWAAAIADATEAFTIVNETEQYVERANSLMVLGKLQGGVGRFEEARRLIGEAFALADECDGVALRYMASSALGFVELSAGDFPAAHRQLLACREVSSQCQDRNPTLWPWRAELVEVAGKLGDFALAQEVSSQLDDDAELHGSNQAYAFAARGRGLVAEDETSMCESFSEALTRFADSPLVFEQARTQLLFAERLIQHGCTDAAAEHLTNALATFDQLGAHPWSARARALPAPKEHPSAMAVFEQLTERELQVAMAVSTGKTSGVAAGELFLSRRTVEHHLAAVYRKLGIRNRTQLASLLNNGNAPPSPRPASDNA